MLFRSLGREPSEREPRVRAVGQSHGRRGVHVEREAAVDALELVGSWPAVGERSLDEDSGHEAEGAGNSSLLGFDLERFLGELLGFRAPFGRGVPNGPLQDFPEAMRTVVSTRQGGTSYAAKLMSLSELKDSSCAKTVFQISPVGDTNLFGISCREAERASISLLNNLLEAKCEGKRLVKSCGWAH